MLIINEINLQFLKSKNTECYFVQRILYFNNDGLKTTSSHLKVLFQPIDSVLEDSRAIKISPLTYHFPLNHSMGILRHLHRQRGYVFYIAVIYAS